MRRKRIGRWAPVLAVGLCLLGLTAVGRAAPLSAAEPDLRTRQIDALLEALVREDGPGCAVAVLREGRRIYQRSRGMANLEHQVPITPRTAFNLASTSKQFTALAVLLLAREGKLSLEDEVRDFLPELHDYGRPIRIRHLLHHTSGIRDYSVLLQYAGLRMYRDYLAPDEVLGTIVRQQGLAFSPGERFEYSNSNYWLLAEIVERVSGTPFGAFLAQRIFEPLGMRRTTLQDDMQKVIPERATGYAPLPGGGFRIKEDTFPSIGDGGVFTTLEDLALWSTSYESPAVGDEDVLRTMTTPGTLDSGEPVPYGGGLEPGEHRGRKIVSHAGFTGGFRAELLRVPSEALAVLVLCNLSTVRPDSLALEIADVVLDTENAPEDEPPPASTEHRSPSSLDARVLGTYHRPGGSIFEFFEDEAGIAGRINGGGELRIERSAEGAYRIVDSPEETFRFLTGADGQATGFEYRPSAGARPSVYERVVPLATDAAREYPGRYTSPDLGVTYEVRSARGLLSLHIVEAGGRRMGPLVRRDGDVFTGGGRETYEFERRPGGRIEALVLEVPRLGRLRLRREAQNAATSPRPQISPAGLW